MPGLSAQLSAPGITDLGEPQPIEPIFPEGSEPSREEWEQTLRPALLERWRAVIGEPSFGEFEREVAILGQFEAPWARGTVYRQRTGPEQWQQVVLLDPVTMPISPRPAAVVPFYHPETMMAFDPAEGAVLTERPNVQFARHLAEQGYVVACMEAFPYNTVPEPEVSTGFRWWRAAAEKLLADNPRWTGIGKLVWDTSRAVDLLLAQPNVDHERVLAIGHSLGGKMAFYTTAFDERITACISSDFGIAWSFTNWETPWYFGEQVQREDFTLNGHHALALIAPRSFFLIAGEADRPESWQYIQEAQRVYRLYGSEHAAGCFMHMTGHQPTEESIRTAYAWLDEQFGLPPREWRLAL